MIRIGNIEEAWHVLQASRHVRLLLRNGYRIRAVQHFGAPDRERIHFFKLPSWNAS